MLEGKNKIIVGFITYGKSTAKYLPYFLPSLTAQTQPGVKIMAIDNSEKGDDENINYIKNNFPEVEIERAEKNLGFAKAYNRMINKAMADGGQYFFAVNPDTILEPNVVEKMLVAIESDEKIGAVAPKILKWDFENKKKTDIVDSYGIKLLPGLRFIDCNEGRREGSDLKCDIIGPSGAGAFYRLSALEKIKQGSQYFDELMFMYKEDCDLAYRLFLAGFKSKCAYNSIIYHDRSNGGMGEGNIDIVLNRKNKSRQIKKWSFLNQQIIFLKYWKIQNFSNKLVIIWYEIKILIFVLLFERYLLKEFYQLYKIRQDVYKNADQRYLTAKNKD